MTISGASLSEKPGKLSRQARQAFQTSQASFSEKPGKLFGKASHVFQTSQARETERERGRGRAIETEKEKEKEKERERESGREIGRMTRRWIWIQNDPGRTRTCNPRLRGPMPYPLGNGARCFYMGRRSLRLGHWIGRVEVDCVYVCMHVCA